MVHLQSRQSSFHFYPYDKKLPKAYMTVGTKKKKGKYTHNNFILLNKFFNQSCYGTTEMFGLNFL